MNITLQDLEACLRDTERLDKTFLDWLIKPNSAGRTLYSCIANYPGLNAAVLQDNVNLKKAGRQLAAKVTDKSSPIHASGENSPESVFNVVMAAHIENLSM